MSRAEYSNFIKCKNEISERYFTYIVSEFSTKHLSGQLPDYVYIDRFAITIKPMSYDTALWIMTSRAGFPVMKYKFNTSYASDLNKKGSEFEVFKKKNHNMKTPISKIPIGQINNLLDRVIVRPHNHRNYANRLLFFAITNTIKKKEFNGVIEQWRVRN